MVDAAPPPTPPSTPATNTFQGAPQEVSAYGPMPMGDGLWKISLPNQVLDTQQFSSASSAGYNVKAYTNTLNTVHNGSMESPLNRPELDAKIRTVEVALDSKLSRIETQLTIISSDAKTTRNAIWGGVATTVAAVLAALAYGNGMFDSGRETSKIAIETQAKTALAQQEMAAALAEIKEIIGTMKAPISQQTNPPPPVTSN